MCLCVSHLCPFWVLWTRVEGFGPSVVSHLGTSVWVSVLFYFYFNFFCFSALQLMSIFRIRPPSFWSWEVDNVYLETKKRDGQCCGPFLWADLVIVLLGSRYVFETLRDAILTDLHFSDFFVVVFWPFRQAESATSKAQTYRLSTLPNEGQIISVFETDNGFLEDERQRLNSFVATGVAILICTVFAESEDSASWPKVSFTSV